MRSRRSILRLVLLVVLTLRLLAHDAQALSLDACTGDCNGDGSVRIHELVTIVSIILGHRPLASCEAADSNGSEEVTIHELVTAVRNAIDACSATSARRIVEIIDETGDRMSSVLYGPLNIAVGAGGNVFVTGNNSDNVFRIGPDGTVTEVLRLSLPGVFLLPQGIAVDSERSIYVSHMSGISRLAPDGTVTGFSVSRGIPIGVAVDTAGNIYVSAVSGFPARAHTLKFAPDGTSEELGVSALALAVDAAGNVYGLSNYVFRIESDGTTTDIIDETGDGLGNTFANPGGLAVDAVGNVYVTGMSTNNAFRIEPDGTITQIIDETGDGRGNSLERPVGIAVDMDGNAYVTGMSSNNAFRIEPDGTTAEIIDETGDGRGNSLAAPVGVAVDATGNAYVTGLDSNNVFRIPKSAHDSPDRIGTERPNQ